MPHRSLDVFELGVLSDRALFGVDETVHRGEAAPDVRNAARSLADRLEASRSVAVSDAARRCLERALDASGGGTLDGVIAQLYTLSSGAVLDYTMLRAFLERLSEETLFEEARQAHACPYCHRFN